MELDLKYGSSEVSLSIPSKAVDLVHSEPPLTVDSEKFKQDLHSFLHMWEKRISSVGIVVSDKTRLCQYPVYLPLLTEVLSEFGVDEKDITFYIAYGTHPVQTKEECLNSYGETYNRFRFVHHNSKADDRLISLGTTVRGTGVKILKEVLDHDLLITFGAVLHHYFAGFGGGRKLLVPGLGGYETILQNHQLFLDFENRKLREGCQSGNLDDNPLALDLEEINTLLPKRLEIHAILNSRKEVCEIHFGTGYDDFRDTCDRYDLFFRSSEERQYDMVVASAGGYPKDINFIQAHKSIHNAASFVKNNGTLIIFAECRDGIGNQAFMNLFKLGGWDRIFEKMASRYENNAGTALAMIHKSRRIKIHFVTSFDKETCNLMGAVKTSPEQAQQLITDETGDMALIENASLVYK
ncbi:MAG: nickel-dependent lactate racemase [Bacteroidales bacterium]|nr:nickel-dependent lactate racemase [Bacteroidales bacterium]